MAIDFRSAARLGACVAIMLSSLAGLARAAPDGTLGMALMSASVQANGTLAFSAGATASARRFAGAYAVTFGRSLADCTCTASVGGNDGNVDYLVNWSVTANCPGLSTPSNVAHIYTTNISSTGASDANFHLIVFCPR